MGFRSKEVITFLLVSRVLKCELVILLLDPGFQWLTNELFQSYNLSNHLGSQPVTFMKREQAPYKAVGVSLVITICNFFVITLRS